MPHQTKEEADYTPLAKNPAERCAVCDHFIPSSSCSIVIGVIRATGWCKNWKTAGEDFGHL